MTLHTVTQPNPPPGTDFTFVVPGRYLYDVVGITATLITSQASPTVAVDASGNGHDGAYNNPPSVPAFVPGLVPGNGALLTNAPALVDPAITVTPPADTIDWSNPFTIVLLYENNAGSSSAATPYFATNGGPAAGDTLEFDISDGPFGSMEIGDTVFHSWVSVNGVIPYDGMPHLIGVTWDGVNVQMYVDGVAVAFATTDTAPPGHPFTSALIQAGSNVFPGLNGILDEYQIYTAAITAGDHASLQAARGSFAAFNAAVLALGPATYYHLADGLGTGRQPSLVVTNGTTELEAIPTGFPAVSTPGPYEYSWQPALNADVQSTDGTLTTVAIPQLLLPAGYTVGVRTLDLTGTDQWSNVALWWDDAYQSAFDPFNDYAFPGGVKLVYQQQGVGP